jgi:hypothetical protein
MTGRRDEERCGNGEDEDFHVGPSLMRPERPSD